MSFVCLGLICSNWTYWTTSMLIKIFWFVWKLSNYHPPPLSFPNIHRTYALACVCNFFPILIFLFHVWVFFFNSLHESRECVKLLKNKVHTQSCIYYNIESISDHLTFKRLHDIFITGFALLNVWRSPPLSTIYKYTFNGINKLYKQQQQQPKHNHHNIWCVNSTFSMFEKLDCEACNIFH